MSNSSIGSGPELPLLLLLGFRTLIDELHEKLATVGHSGARPMHGFVCQAVGHDGATAVQIGRRLRISKQAAGKLIATLEQEGYVTRVPDADDARRKLVRLSGRGRDLLGQSARIFEELHADWSAVLGEERIKALEDDLRRVTAGAPSRLLDIPGWFARG